MDIDAELPDLEQRGKGRRGEFVSDIHLQNPIRLCVRRFLISSYTEVPTYLIREHTECPIPRGLINIHSEKLYGPILNATFSPNLPLPDQDANPYRISLDVLNDILSSIAPKITGITEVPIDLHLSSKSLKALTLKRSWERLRDKMRGQLGAAQAWVEVTRLPLPISRAIASEHYLLLQVGDNPSWHVLDYDQVMMCADTVAARALCLAYLDLLPRDSPGWIDSDYLISLYNILDHRIELTGNETYKEIKYWEPVVLAVLLDLHDPMARAHKFGNTIRETLELEGYDGMIRVYEMLTRARLSSHALAELHGIYRHWGHPTVNEIAGCEKVQRVASSRGLPQMSVVQEITGLLRRQVVASFFTKYGRWPSIERTEDIVDTRIWQEYSRGATVLNLYSHEYPIEDWAKVRFGKEFDLDLYPDYTELMDDKSIAPLLPEFDTMFDPITLGYRPTKPTTSRRCLYELLKKLNIDTNKLIRLVQTNSIPVAWKIICLSAKEREIKVDPRLFAMFVFEVRMLLCLLQKNIAQNIFPLFPQQTMNLDEAQLSKRLYMFSKTSDESDTLQVTAGIDFSSWNICWTEDVMWWVQHIFDELHGTGNLFTWPHRFFRECMVVLSSRFEPPTSIQVTHRGGYPPRDRSGRIIVSEQLSCSTLWFNHIGGFEGILQKDWTIATIGLLSAVERRTGVRALVMGQGDNQIIKMFIPVPPDVPGPEAFYMTRPDEVNKIINNYFTVLEELASGINLIVKPEETWVSSNLLIYGKEIFVNGVWLPQGLKKASRLGPGVNQTYTSTHTYVSSLQTGGMSISQKTFDPCIPYALCGLETLTLVAHQVHEWVMSQSSHSWYKDLINNRSFYMFLALLSSDVGCFPIQPFLAYLYRGHPDSLTTYTTTLDILRDKNVVAQQIWDWLSSSDLPLGPASPELLVSNPCALNIREPPTLVTAFKRFLENALRVETRNPHLRFLFTQGQRGNGSHLIKYLLQTDPLYPRFCHEVFLQTIMGAVLHMLSKFSNTKTTQRLPVLEGEGASMVEISKRYHHKYMEHLVSLFLLVTCRRRPESHISDPTEMARYLRQRTWKPLIGDRILEGVTIPHPCHQFTASWPTSPTHEGCSSKSEYICYRVMDVSTPQFLQGDPQWWVYLLSRGDFGTYAGSQTHEKRAGKLMVVPVNSRPFAAACRLQELVSWCVEQGSGLEEFMNQLSESRTNLDLLGIKAAACQIAGGSLTHRLNDHITKRGTLNNVRPNLSTHVYLSTDDMGKLARGLENYNLHFQGAMHLGYTIMQLSLVWTKRLPSQNLHLHYTASSCCEEILNDCRITGPPSHPRVNTCSGNPLLYCQIECEQLTIQRDLGEIVTLSSHADPSVACAYLFFISILTRLSYTKMGLVEYYSPPISSVGVAEMIGCGLKKIMYHLSWYLLLILDLSSGVPLRAVMSLPPDVWREIASLCLLPELQAELHEEADGALTANLFSTRDALPSVLQKCMIERVSKNLSMIEQEHTSNPPWEPWFFPSKELSSGKMLLLWARWLSIRTKSKFHIVEDVEIMLRGTANSLSTLPTVDQQCQLSDLIMGKFRTSGYVQIMLSHKPRFCLNPAEMECRRARLSGPKPKSTKVLPDLNPLTLKFTVDNLTYPVCTSTTPRVPGVTYEKIEFPVDTELRRERTFFDHSLRLYGVMSTSYMKVSEILAQERVDVTGACVTLAEGEGSIARCLIGMGAPLIYYNSLVSTQHLIAHRGVALVPSTCLDVREKVLMGELSALTGGDLTDERVVQDIIKYLPENQSYSVVTLDAEVSFSSNPASSLRLLLAWALVILKTRAKVGIIKGFSASTIGTRVQWGVAHLLFKHTKLIVTTFSSHESSEYYLYSTDMDPVIDYGSLWNCYLNGVIPLPSNSIGFTGCISAFHMERSKPNRLPFGYRGTRPQRVKTIYQLANQIGFPDNLGFCLTKMTGFKISYTGGSVHEWLSEASTTLSHCAKIRMQRESLSYQARAGKTPYSTEIPMDRSLHREIESYIMGSMNCLITQHILTIPGSQVLNRVSRILEGDQLLTTESGVVLYRWTPDISEWKSTYLKTLWRIWGHANVPHPNPRCEELFSHQWAREYPWE